MAGRPIRGRLGMAAFLKNLVIGLSNSRLETGISPVRITNAYTDRQIFGVTCESYRFRPDFLLIKIRAGASVY